MEKLELRFDWLDGGRVMAVMLFPTRPDLREAHVVRELVSRAAEGLTATETLTVTARDMRLLLTAPGQAEMSAHAAEATKRGTVAGDILNLVYEMHARGEDWPSLGKAIDEYKAFALGRKYGDGDPLKYSEQTLRTYWNEFKPVAHLWGAFRMNFGPYAYEQDARAVFHSETALLRLVGVAKGLADFISSYVPKGTRPRVPLIRPEELVALPGTVPTMRLKFGARGEGANLA